MLRSAVARAGFNHRVQAGSLAGGFRFFSVSSCRNAPPKPQPKKKVKVGYKPKETKEKAKKSGMTHLKFEDAVRKLNFERQARDLLDLGLAELSVDSLASVGSSVVKYNAETEKALQELGSFKKAQHHELFRNPVSLVSDNTLAIKDSFLSKLDGPSKDNRVILLGQKGVGKSTLVTQAQALALSQHSGDVVLLHLDFPERIVEGTSDYIFNTNTKKYQQPMFTKRWIRWLRQANEAVFKKMPLTRDISFVAKKVEHNLKKDTNTVHDFLTLNHDFGVSGPTAAFAFFVEELQAHSAQFPVFVSIDNFNALTVEPHTKYYHPDMRHIHFTEFEMGHFIERLVSGELSFAKGGVLLAESKDAGESKTLRVGLGLQEHNPYDKISQCDTPFAETMRQNGGIRTFQVQNLLKDHARALLEFWKSSGALQVRDYPTKAVYKTSEDGENAQAIKVGQFVASAHPETQIESILQASYIVSSGNPGNLLRANHLVF